MPASHTQDPQLVDLDFFASADFQGKFTDYLNLLQLYPNETVMSYVYHYAKTTPDPVFSEAKFFIDIHRGLMQSANNPQGAVNPFANEQASLRTIEQQLADNEFLVLDGNNTIQLKGNKVLIEVREFNDGQLSKVQKWKEIETFPAMSPSTSPVYGLPNLQPQFLLHWLEIANTTSTEVQELIGGVLRSDLVYYSFFGDSIGALKNVDFIKDLFVLPIYDINSEIGYIPYMYNSVLGYVAKNFQKRVTKELSKKTNAVFRRNAVVAMDDPYEESPSGALNTQSHGINMVTDIEHYVRMKSEGEGLIRKALAQHLKGLYKLLTFISSNIENQHIKRKYINVDIEGLRSQVDFLKQKTHAVTKTITNDQMLKS